MSRVGGRALLSIAFVTLIPIGLQSVAAQQLPRGASAVEGKVVSAGRGDPIAGATVELTPVSSAEGVFRFGTWITQPGPHYTATTTADGRFFITDIPAGSYRLHATQALGFVLSEYGQRSANGRGQPLTVADGQRLRDLQLAMTPAGSISGRVLDRDGEPVVRAFVQAYRPTYSNGRRILRVIQSVQTNDLGEYRLFWLPPGSYFVGVRVGDPHAESAQVLISLPGAGGSFETVSAVQSRRVSEAGESYEEALVTVYYPGTVDSQQAARVELRPGEHLGGLEMSTAAGRIRSRHVRGVLLDQSTNEPGDGMVILSPRDPSSDFQVPSTNADREGFDIAGVLPGPYYLFAFGNGGMLLQALDVGDADVEGLRIGTGPRGLNSYQGRVVVEGDTTGAGAAGLTKLQVKVEREPNIAVLPPPPPPPPGATPSGAVSASGDFRLNFLPPGDYRLSVAGMPPDLYLKSARIGNRDLLSELLHVEAPPEGPIQVTLSARPGMLRGRVLNEKQQPSAGATVALVPDSSRNRFDLYKSTTTDDFGTFEIFGIAEGNYKIFAWEDVEQSAWQNAEFMRAFEARGRPVRIEESGRQEIEIPLIAPPR